MVCAYLDAFSGLSGDMLVGALLDLGLQFAEFKQAMDSLGLHDCELRLGRRELSGIAAAKFDVEVAEPQPERHLRDIRTIIERSGLADEVKAKAIAIFTALAGAEAKVHNSTPEEVHFHEVGAVDSIIDIVGTAWCLASLQVDELLVSPLPMGKGFARTRHGLIPIPPPATVELLRGFQLKLGDGEAEMVTPTGAAILNSLAKPAPLPLGFEVHRVGYGAGTKTFTDRPNALRVLLGKRAETAATDELLEIQTNIDDLNPQIYDHLCERLFAAGARDVTLTPTIMKKGRPAITVAVLAEAALREAIAAVLFEESTTIGIRFHPVSRLKLEREIKEIATRWGTIRVKVSRRGGGAATIAPEYEDCRRAAQEHRVALKVVMQDAMAAARAQLEAPAQLE
jgi:pyridinium-3,5-bisthiocarboxylic acid mononucleotide nickel chelatase